MTGPFAGIAGVAARGMQLRDEIEQRRKAEAEAAEQRKIQQAAMIAAMGEQGIMPEGEAPRESMQINSVIGSRPQQVQSVAPQRDPAYKPLGGTGYVQGPKPAQIAAQRQQEQKIRQRSAALRALPQYRGMDPEALQAIAMDDDAWQDAVKYREPAKAPTPTRWQTVTASDGIYQVNPETGEKRPTGLRPPPPASSGYRDMSAAASLRGQFKGEQAIKDAEQVATAYKKIKAAANNPSAAGDLSLIFGYMKMLDPGSTVREGEFANAQNAAGVPDQIRNLYERARKGTRLNPAQRADFLRQAELIAQAQRQSSMGVIRHYTEIAGRNGMNPRDIVRDPFDAEPQGKPFPEY